MVGCFPKAEIKRDIIQIEECVVTILDSVQSKKGEGRFAIFEL